MSFGYTGHLDRIYDLLASCLNMEPALRDIIDPSKLKPEPPDSSPFTVAVIGAMKSGKSTFINALLGTDLMPNETEACTLTTTDVIHAPHDGKVAKRFADRTEFIIGEQLAVSFHEDVRDSRRNPQHEPYFYEVRYELDALKDRAPKAMPFHLIDTPGINEMEHGGLTKAHIESIFHQSLSRAKVIIYIIDTQYYRAEENKEILSSLRRLRPDLVPHVIFALNKVDRLDESKDASIVQFVEDVRETLRAWGYEGNPIYPVSARKALIARLTPKGELTESQRRVMLSYMPERTVLIDGEHIMVRAAPEKNHELIFEQSGFSALEEKVLGHLYDHIELEAEREAGNRLSSTLRFYSNIIDQLQDATHSDMKGITERIERGVRQLKALENIILALEEAIHDFEGLTKKASTEQTALNAHKYNVPSIPVPVAMSSGAAYPASSSAREAGLQIFDAWYEDMASKYPLQLYNSLRSELSTIGKGNFFGETAAAFGRRAQELNRQLMTLQQELGERLRLDALPESLIVHPDMLREHRADAVQLHQQQFRNEIVTEAHTKSFLLFFTDTNYSYSIASAVQHAKLAMGEALKKYDRKLKDEIIQVKYERYPKALLSLVISPIMEALTRTQSSIKAIDAELAGYESEIQSKSIFLSTARQTNAFLRHTASLMQMEPVRLPENGVLDSLIRSAGPDELIQLPAGTFTIKRRHELKHGLVIRGAGNDTVIRLESKGAFNLASEEALFSMEKVRLTVHSSGPAVSLRGRFATFNECTFEGELGQIGLRLEGNLEAEIRNCTFNRFSVGIEASDHCQLRVYGSHLTECKQSGITGSGGSIVKLNDTRFERNGTGVQFAGKAGGTITDCELAVHTSSAVHVTDEAMPIIKSVIFKANATGLAADGASAAYVSGNQFHQNKKAGIAVRGQAMGKILNNLFEDNTVGIQFENEANPDIYGNECRSNQTGMLVQGTAAGKLHNNTYRNNSRFGVEVRESAKPEVTNNRFEGNEAGICIGGSSESQMDLNTCVDNRLAGIVVLDKAQPRLSQNQCENNENGIVLQGQSEAKLFNNRCIGNRAAGIAVSESAAGNFSNNVCSNNNIGVMVSGAAKPSLQNTVCENNGTGMAVTDQALLKSHGGAVRQGKVGYVISKKSSAVIENGECSHTDKGVSCSDEAELTLHRSRFAYHADTAITLAGSSLCTASELKVSSCATGILAKEDAAVNFHSIHIQGGSTGMELNGRTSGSLHSLDIASCSGDGIRIRSNGKLQVEESFCSGNAQGIAIYDQAVPVLARNRLMRNKVGLIYGDTGAGEATENSIEFNAVGIMCRGSSHPVLTGNSIQENEIGMQANGRAGAIIRENRVDRNMERGILLLGSNSACIVQRNTVTGNVKTGIYIGEQACPELVDNRVSGSEIGILSEDKAECVIRSNLISVNQIGLRADGRTSLVLLSNTASENGQGFLLSGNANVRADGNSIVKNRSTGIHVTRESVASIVNNRINENGGDGIRAEDDVQIVFEQNAANANGGHGISLKNQASGILTRNECMQNAMHAVYVERTTSILINKTKSEKNGVKGISRSGISNRWNMIISKRNTKKRRNTRKEGSHAARSDSGTHIID
ncbi:right-handed parallel beta-helix repeat-containing protein [Paenibacillus agaridevorans]|uniref:right-handed parallel beta-helix repeat-containing protein n=1 Tax=Paenibacillus agaridevorans TaxID=171404 RepID=UPI001BE3E7EE|nr:right-handed parallel beta-helix repeat-containing protein [Paenibacillus agaridevorans]